MPAAKGLITPCHDSFNFDWGICPWRARICQRPTLDWKIPSALARSVTLEIRSIASAVARKRVIESSFKPWNSEKIRYWLP